MKKIAIFIAFALLFSACAKKAAKPAVKPTPSNPGPASPNNNVPTAFEGKWKTNCEWDTASGYSLQMEEELIFSGNQVTYNVYNFQTEDCSDTGVLDSTKNFVATFTLTALTGDPVYTNVINFLNKDGSVFRSEEIEKDSQGVSDSAIPYELLKE